MSYSREDSYGKCVNMPKEKGGTCMLMQGCPRGYILSKATLHVVRLIYTCLQLEEVWSWRYLACTTTFLCHALISMQLLDFKWWPTCMWLNYDSNGKIYYSTTVCYCFTVCLVAPFGQWQCHIETQCDSDKVQINQLNNQQII